MMSSAEEAGETGVTEGAEGKRGNIDWSPGAPVKEASSEQGGCLRVLVVKDGPLIEAERKKQVFQGETAAGNAPRGERA